MLETILVQTFHNKDIWSGEGTNDRNILLFQNQSLHIYNYYILKCMYLLRQVLIQIIASKSYLNQRED